MNKCRYIKKPVIAVKASGVEDMVVNGLNGYMTEETPEVWAEQLAALMLDEEQREQLSFGAYTTAAKYSENKIAERAAEAYNRTICDYRLEVDCGRIHRWRLG